MLSSQHNTIGSYKIHKTKPKAAISRRRASWKDADTIEHVPVEQITYQSRFSDETASPPLPITRSSTISMYFAHHVLSTYIEAQRRFAANEDHSANRQCLHHDLHDVHLHIFPTRLTRLTNSQTHFTLGQSLGHSAHNTPTPFTSNIPKRL